MFSVPRVEEVVLHCLFIHEGSLCRFMVFGDW